jgi:predicted RNase H-like HicB family nuclease
MVRVERWRCVDSKSPWTELASVHLLLTSVYRRTRISCKKVKVGLQKLKKAPRMIYMNFTVTLDRDEDGVWVAECPSIPGCVSQGESREDALANVREAITLCLEVRSERGMPLTVETRQVEVAV